MLAAQVALLSLSVITNNSCIPWSINPATLISTSLLSCLYVWLISKHLCIDSKSASWYEFSYLNFFTI